MKLRLLNLLFCLFFGMVQAKSPSRISVSASLQSYIAELDANSKPIDKYFIYNHITQYKKVKIADWKAELHGFLSLNINHPQIKNDYVIDTLWYKNSVSIRYQAKKPSNTLQYVAYKLNAQGALVELCIKNITDNMLYHSREQLLLRPHKLYRIEKESRILFFSAIHCLIIGKWKY